MCLEPDWKFWFSRLNSLKNTWYQKSFGFRLESPKKPEFRNFFHVEPISCSKWIAFDIFRRSKSQFFLSFFLYFRLFFSQQQGEWATFFSPVWFSTEIRCDAEKASANRNEVTSSKWQNSQLSEIYFHEKRIHVLWEKSILSTKATNRFLNYRNLFIYSDSRNSRLEIVLDLHSLGWAVRQLLHSR